MPKILQPGENQAVDLAVIADGHLLMIRRGDGGGWAIPGGMVHDGEGDLDAMVRELREETGVSVWASVRFVTDRIPVDDPRNRPDAWITTVLGLVRLPEIVRAVGADDATDALWVPLTSYDVMDAWLRDRSGAGIYGAHWPLVMKVLEAS